MLCCSWILPLFDLSPTQPLFQSSSSSSSLSIFECRSLTEVCVEQRHASGWVYSLPMTSRTRTTTRTSTIEESKRGGINPLMRPAAGFEYRATDGFPILQYVQISGCGGGVQSLGGHSVPWGTGRILMRIGKGRAEHQELAKADGFTGANGAGQNGTKLTPVWDGSRSLIFSLRPK
jgi:hypothetical protein